MSAPNNVDRAVRLQKSPRRIVPTLRQHLIVGKLVENGGNKYRALRAAGYSHAQAKNPSRVLNAAGFKEAAREMGLTEELLVNALVEDIKEKKHDRKAELELGFKVLGLVNKPEPETPPAGNTYNTYIQQNNLDPNSSRELVRNTLESLMNGTKRKVTVDGQ